MWSMYGWLGAYLVLVLPFFITPGIHALPGVHNTDTGSSYIPLTNATDVGKSAATCTDTTDWKPTGGTWNPLDCQETVNLWRRTFLRNQETNKDTYFYDDHIRPSVTLRYPKVLLPVIFSYESCTLGYSTISLLNGVLPGEGGRYPEHSDIALLSEIDDKLGNLLLECIYGRTQNPGWHTAGRQRAIVVGLWGTDSKIDKHVQDLLDARAQAERNISTATEFPTS